MGIEKVDRKTRLQGSIILFCTGLIWGFHHIVVRSTLDSLTTHQVQLYEYLIAAIALLIVFRKKLKNITKAEVIHGTAIGIVVFFGQMLQIYATGMTSVGKVSFITVLHVITVPLIAWVFFKRRISIGSIIAVCLAVPGLYILTQASGGINKGDLLAFAGSLCFAAQILIIDRCVKNDDEQMLAVVQVTASAVCSIVVAIISRDQLIITGLTLEGWLCFLYIGLLSSALCFYLQIVGQAKVTPQMASVILTTEAPAATIFAAIFLREGITLKSAIGCLIMLAAMIIAQF